MGIVDDRDRLITQHGPWVACNIEIAPGVYTMEPGQIGVNEFQIQSVVQAVRDLAGKPLDTLRVLDLGCHEGGYAIEMGLHGAEVIGIEGRLRNVAKARFAAQALGLDRVSFELADIRELSEDRYGRFDVVLCLGILYHLHASDAVELIRRCYDLCDRLTVIRSAVGLSPDFDETVNGVRYRGRRYREDQRHAGASIGNEQSIFPMRSSLLNLLADVGFSSVHEVLNPVVPELEDMRDHLLCVAVRGERISARAIPDLADLSAEMRRREHRRPLWLWQTANPTQGPYWRLRERLTHAVRRTSFVSRGSADHWRRRR